MNPIIDENGNQCWYNEAGQLHRIDGPAFISSTGEQHWLINGKVHRTDGPAIIRPNGYQAYCFNYEYHRLDGPAIIYANGEQYWIRGNLLTEEQFNDITQSEEHLNWYLLHL